MEKPDLNICYNMAVNYMNTDVCDSLCVKLSGITKLLANMTFMLLTADTAQPSDKLLHKTWSGVCCRWLFCGSVPVSKLVYRRGNCCRGAAAYWRQSSQVQLFPGRQCQSAYDYFITLVYT